MALTSRSAASSAAHRGRASSCAPSRLSLRSRTRKAVLARNGRANHRPPSLHASTGASARPMATPRRQPRRVYALDLVGCHGQTIYHQGIAEALRRPQHRLHLAVGRARADRRRRSCARRLELPSCRHGRRRTGSAARPLARRTLFAHPRRARVLQNLGGIANLTPSLRAEHSTA